MTAVHLDLRQPTPGGTDAPAGGVVSWVPTRRRNVTTYIVLPEPFSVALVNGAATVTVAASGADWCWQVDEPNGTRRYVAVTVSGPTLEYNALPDVDLDTLSPTVEPQAAWTVAQTALANRVTALEVGGGGGTPTDGSVTNVKVAGGAAITLDKTADYTSSTGRLAMTNAERTKLAGVATAATANSADATLLARANHIGTQSADTIIDGSTNKAFTAAEDTKLAGIATAATANSSDATLLARANHTGVEVITALPTGIPVDVFQPSGGTWPSTPAEATRRTNWIGYPGLTTLPATTGRPAAVAGLDSYDLRT